MSRSAVRARLPHSGSTLSRGHEIRIGLLGVLGLIVLVVGVPAALVIFVGYPLPRTAPSTGWLTTEITASLIIKVLACVVWLVWAHFTICIAAEWRALRRGRLPGSVPLGGGSQLLARRLVAAAIMLAGVATLVPHGGGSGSSPGHFRPSTPVAARAAVGHAPTPVRTPADGSARGADLGTQQSTDQAAEQQAHSATKYYVVQPPHGRRYDSLWDIADRTLHDPRRYPEIFDLNKNRVQSDGRSLVNANLIMPGWQLILPADASGPGVQTMLNTAEHIPADGAGGAKHAAGPVHAATVAHHGAETPAPVRAPLPDGGVVTHHVSAAHGATAATAAPTDTTASSPSALRIGLGGGLLLAGLALAVSTRRGPYGETDEGPDVLSGGDPEIADLLDRELRRLAAARTEQGRELPQPLLARVSTGRIALQLVGGDVADPPAPWRVDPAGRVWELVVGADETPAPPVAAPFPGLVSIGQSNGAELFLDLEQAPGPIAVGGASGLDRDVVTAIAVQAATSQWSDGVRVTMVGFADGAAVAEIDPALISTADSLEPVLDTLEHERAGLLRLYKQLGISNVLSGRQLRTDDAWRPRIVVLSGPPTARESARLQALVGDGRSSVIVLIVGDSSVARWRFAVDPSGRLDLGALGGAVQAYRLDTAAIQDIATLFRDADTRRHDRSAAVARLAPSSAAAEVSAERAGPAIMPADSDVRVQLLGPVEVQAPGVLDAARAPQASELVVAVALHPDGIHDAVLRASIWPRGVGDDTAAAAVRDAQQWLGTAPDGMPCLREDPATGWRLVGVRTDWDAIRALAASASGATELDVLRRALAEVRGEIFTPAGRGRYHWLAFGRAARDARVLVTAIVRRVATLLQQQDRAQEAEAVLRQGVAAVPTAELIWRDLLQLAGRGGPEPAAAVAEQLYAVLAAHHVTAEAETDALVAQVAPAYPDRGRTLARSSA